jgi:hypothetical protein
MRFNVRLDTSYHGPPHPFRDAGVVADSLTGTSLLSTGVACTRVLGVPTGKNPEDSNLENMMGMQWILLYLSIRYDRC